MENNTYRQLRPGTEYDRFFTKPSYKDPIVEKQGNVFLTPLLVKAVVKESIKDTSLIAPVLKGADLNQTCKNIWNFLYYHIAYKLDKDFVEQVRTPARSWADRKSGIDCDCYTAFASSILTNLDIPHTYRIAAYGKTNRDGSPQYQHIYVVVPTGKGNVTEKTKRSEYLVIDPVKDQYNSEHPYSAIKDYPMDLAMQVLNGPPTDQTSGLNDFILAAGTGKIRVHLKKAGKVSKHPLNTEAPEKKAELITPSEVSAQAANNQIPNPGFTPAKRTNNEGVLKNGNKVSLGPAVPTPGAFVWDGSGSQNGILQQNYQFLVNGVWDGKTVYRRFTVSKGIVWGIIVMPNGSCPLFVDRGNGPMILKADIRDPGVPLGSIGSSVDAMWTINSTGQIISNPLATLPGMLIPQDIFDSIYSSRGKGTNGLSGLGALGVLFGLNGLAAIADEMNGFGNFELDGLDGVEGLGLISGYDNFEVSGLGKYSDGLEKWNTEPVSGPYDSIAVMDGLGRVSRAKLKRSATTVQANSQTPTSYGKKLGLYIPGNTLKNLILLYNANVKRLQTNGHTIDRGSIPQLIDGPATNGLNGLGSWFKNLVHSASSAVSKLSEITSPITSLIPGGQSLNLVKMLSDHVSENTKPSDNNPGPQNQQSQSVAVSQDYVAQNNDEAMQAYNAAAAAASGLSGVSITENPITWATENPLMATAAAVIIGWGAWSLLKPKSKTKGASGLGKTSKRKPKAKVYKYKPLR